MASAVNSPVVKLPLASPVGAPVERPPCKRHRLRSRMAGHWQGPPALVFAPQRGAVLRFVSWAMTRPWFMRLFVNFSFPPPYGRLSGTHFGSPIPFCVRELPCALPPGWWRTWCFRRTCDSGTVFIDYELDAPIGKQTAFFDLHKSCFGKKSERKPHLLSCPFISIHGQPPPRASSTPDADGPQKGRSSRRGRGTTPI
jgi:hypothetical protein